MPSRKAAPSEPVHEDRSFETRAEFAAQANATEDWYEKADRDPDGFWAEQAERLHWHQKWDGVLDWDAPHAKWFVGGQLNVAYNCVDRHVEDGHGEQVAIHWEGEPGDTRTITYADLKTGQQEGQRADELGVQDGDRVAIPAADDPQAVFAMLACDGGAPPTAWSSAGFRRERALAHRGRGGGAITSDGSSAGEAGPMKEKPTGGQDTPTSARAGGQAHRAEVTWTRARRLVARVGEKQSDRRGAAVRPRTVLILYTRSPPGNPGIRTSGGFLTQARVPHHVVFDTSRSAMYWCPRHRLGHRHSYTSRALANRATR